MPKLENKTNGFSQFGVLLTKSSFLLSVLVVVWLGPAWKGRSQTFTVLHSFDAGNGPGPLASVTLSGSNLYGTTFGTWGSSTNGSVFKVNTDGTGFMTLHTFSGATDGRNPWVGLTLLGTSLYGTTVYGGTGGSGTVFAIGTDGMGFSTLYSFSPTGNGSTNSDGVAPLARLTVSSNILYGTTSGGGTGGSGTVFAITNDGYFNVRTLYSLSPTSGDILFGGGYSTFTNSDGEDPSGDLVVSATTVYGTAFVGGNYGMGTVFAVDTDGTGFSVLHHFANVLTAAFTNDEGVRPFSGVILSDNVLYGTAARGGNSSWGTVFKINTDGTGFRVLHSFTGPYANSGPITNSDGAGPQGALVLSGNTLYGTTSEGGSSGSGTVFAINTDGTGFKTLYYFAALTSYTNRFGSVIKTNSDGASPRGGVILSGNTFYGTTSSGGTEGSGTVFSISLSPQLTIISSGQNVVLTWPTNVTGFTLQSATSLGPSASWTTNLPAPVVVNGQNTVTNPISGTQEFFRLSQ